MDFNFNDVVMLKDEELYFVTGFNEVYVWLVLSASQGFRTPAGALDKKVKRTDVIKQWKQQKNK